MLRFKKLIILIACIAILVIIAMVIFVSNNKLGPSAKSDLNWFYYPAPQKTPNLKGLKSLLPVSTDIFTDATGVYVDRTVWSSDGEQAFVAVTTDDRTKPADPFDGSYPILSEQYFFCDLKKERCEVTDILAKANLLVPGGFVWMFWNPAEHLLLGHVEQEGRGETTPLATFNTETSELREAAEYEIYKPDQGPWIPYGSFSPSLTKVVVNEWWLHKLLLYSVNNLAQPLATYDINLENSSYRIESVKWSPQENQMALGFDHGNTGGYWYLLDLQSRALSKL